MHWLNLHVSTLDSHDVVRCDPVRRATWLFLLRYCVGQENGGVIRGCRAWGDTTWQQICRVKLREVRAISPLWTWEGDDLRVAYYPTEQEQTTQANRANGCKGGRPKQNRADNHPDNHPVSDPVTEGFEIAETERKGKERKGREGNPPASPPSDTREKPGGDGGARSRIIGIDLRSAAAAVQAGDPLALVGAFCGNRDAGRDREWLRDAEGMRVGELAAVLYRGDTGEPIREPSGLRRARKAWAALTTEERRTECQAALAFLGVQVAPPAQEGAA